MNFRVFSVQQVNEMSHFCGCERFLILRDYWQDLATLTGRASADPVTSEASPQYLGTQNMRAQQVRVIQVGVHSVDKT